MITQADLLLSVLFEHSRNGAFQAFVREACAKLRAQGAIAGADTEALGLPLEDGRLLGKALLDTFLARSPVPQWMMAREAIAPPRR